MRTIALVVTSLSLLLSPGPAAGSPATKSPGAESPDAARRATVDLRVASYNVVNVSVDRSEGERRPWRERRTSVIANILGEEVDVIGVQEVNPSKAFASRLVDGENQFLDLRNGLNKAGGSYALTNRFAFNCKRHSTPHNCQKVNRGASHSDRILYNTRTLHLVDQGKVKYDAQVAQGSPAYLAWAVLRSRANGKELLFTTTHLAPKADEVRAEQWREMIRAIDELEDGRPVVATGDFNTHKFAPLAQQFLPRMKEAGYGDVLNQEYRDSTIDDPRAARTVNGWMNTANRFNRDVRTFGYWSRQFKAGNNIDWVFADNQLPVREWKVVTSWNPETWQVHGVIPSDHNMVRATIGLG